MQDVLKERCASQNSSHGLAEAQDIEIFRIGIREAMRSHEKPRAVAETLKPGPSEPRFFEGNEM